MNVQELIEELQKIPNKNLRVNIGKPTATVNWPNSTREEPLIIYDVFDITQIITEKDHIMLVEDIAD